MFIGVLRTLLTFVLIYVNTSCIVINYDCSCQSYANPCCMHCDVVAGICSHEMPAPAGN